MKRLALLLSLALVGCGENPLAPVVEPSPSPEPATVKVHVIVGLAISQGGRPITEHGVEANKDFKVTGTATRCLDDADHPTECPFIPFWDIDQTSGFGAACTRYGNDNNNYRTFNCAMPIGDAGFKACAQDWDRKELGCDATVINIG